MSNPFEGVDFGDPHADFTEHESYQGRNLYGRFKALTESERAVLYQVLVKRADPLTSFVVNCTARPLEVAHLSPDELRQKMQKRAFDEARRRLDANEFTNEETYPVPFEHRQAS